MEEKFSESDRTATPRTSVWMTEQEVSEHLKVPVDTLRDWRRTGAVKVLPFHRIGRLVRYELSDVEAAVRASRVEVSS